MDEIEVALEARDWTAAEEILARSGGIATGNPWLLYGAANLELAREQYFAARELLTQAIASCSAEAEFFRARAKALLWIHEPGAALADIERSVELDANHPDAHFSRGIALRDLRRYDDSIAAYKRALELRPDHAQTLNNLGALLQLQGDLVAARDYYRRAIALAPDIFEPYMNLGRLLELQGDTRAAAETYRSAIARSLHPEAFTHLLNAGEGVTSERAPVAYTRQLFDSIAEHFDHRLVEELHYRIPEILARSVRDLLDSAAAVYSILDLGCGTGLCGVRVRDLAARLVGVDVSPAMLEKARRRAIYDELVERDLVDYLRTVPVSAFNVVLAADVFIYLGALDAVFHEVQRILAPKGLFALSIETTDEECDFELRRSGRYAQSPAYIRRLAAVSGLTEAKAFARAIRGKPGSAVAGHVFVLRRNG